MDWYLAIQVLVESLSQEPGRLDEKKELAKLVVASKDLTTRYAPILRRFKICAGYAARATLALEGFIRCRDVEGVEAALASGADVNTNIFRIYGWRRHDCSYVEECTPLHLAADASEGHVGVMTMLLEAGACVDTPSSYGRTALSVAAHQGYRCAMQILLAAGADPNSRAYDDMMWDGSSVLLQSLERPNNYFVKREDFAASLFKMLVDAGADTSGAHDSMGNTLLNVAAHQGYVDVIDILVAAGAERP